MRGLIGHPLGHSFSKLIHEKINQKEYQLLDYTKEEVEELLKSKIFHALNVTIPYKHDVIEYLDKLDSVSRITKTVNTIVNKDGKLVGYNTDYFGLKYLLKHHQVNLQNKNVLILGTGATSNTVYKVCKDLKANKISKVSRRKQPHCFTYEEVLNNQTLLNNVHIIINTTPVGMYPNVDEQVMSIKDFKNLTAVIDVVYNPYKTNLLLEAKEAGIKYVGGLMMLVAQAVYAVELFDDLELSFNDKKSLINTIYKDLLLKKVNIVLIGMPGSGKSTMGKLLSSELKMNFYDLDYAFQYKYKKSPSDVINTLGVEEFRKMETEVAKEYSKLENSIIATGGGIVTIDENYDYFKHNSIIIYLERKPSEKTLERNRPLSNNIEAWENLYNERHHLYMKWKDYKVDSSIKKTDTLKKILNCIK